ncbi:MAG: hypothetical protein Q7W45_02255 [Bacteroidota bacterium]|nr:hypothetical protein [Bacteroidota bacterium]MDP3145926.1 hypothetical protein [Bacteroidota bacterium]
MLKRKTSLGLWPLCSAEFVILRKNSKRLNVLFWTYFFLDKKVSKKSRLLKILLKIFMLQADDLSASRTANARTPAGSNSHWQFALLTQANAFDV